MKKKKTEATRHFEGKRRDGKVQNTPVLSEECHYAEVLFFPKRTAVLHISGLEWETEFWADSKLPVGFWGGT